MNGEPPAARSKSLVYVVVAVAAVVIAMYVWKQVTISRQAGEAEMARSTLIAEHREREAVLERAVEQQTRRLLGLLAVPLGWAVRTEAIQEDWGQIEEYFAHLVKEPVVERIALIAPDGSVKITTDKKLQGEAASRFYGDLASADDVELRLDGGSYHLMVPVLGYNSRLGSLVVTFSRAELLRQAGV